MISNKIDKNRFTNLNINLGEAFKNKEVTVEFEKHKFLFGCNGFGFIEGKLSEENSRIYKEKFLKIFNSATLPFYWGTFESIEGKTIKPEMLEAAKWAVKNGLTLKGHPLCWHTVCADWLLKYNNSQILEKQMARIRREVGDFMGYIDMWDAINEVVILPEFDRYDNAISRIAKDIGAKELALRCFKEAKGVDPNTKLLINDFNLSVKYEDLISELLDMGCPIDAIGLQTHQHQGYLGLDYIDDVLDRFSKFNIPLHFTEMTILSGDLAPSYLTDLNDAARDSWPSTTQGEEIQMNQLKEVYSRLYSHPLVEAIVWWDLIDGNWLNAPSGLLRRDLSEKPAFKALETLVKREWTPKPQKVKLDSNGVGKIFGPEGLYKVKTSEKINKVHLHL